MLAHGFASSLSHIKHKPFAVKLDLKRLQLVLKFLGYESAEWKQKRKQQLSAAAEWYEQGTTRTVLQGMYCTAHTLKAGSFRHAKLSSTAVIYKLNSALFTLIFYIVV